MTAKLTPAQVRTLEAFKANGGVWHHYTPEFKFHRGTIYGLGKAGLLVEKGSHSGRDLRYELTNLA